MGHTDTKIHDKCLKGEKFPNNPSLGLARDASRLKHIPTYLSSFSPASCLPAAERILSQTPTLNKEDDEA